MEPEQILLQTLATHFFQGPGWPEYAAFRVQYEGQRQLLDELVRRGWLSQGEHYQLTLLGLAHTEGPVALDIRLHVRAAVQKMKAWYRASPSQVYKSSTTSDPWLNGPLNSKALELLWPLGVLVRFSEAPNTGGVSHVQANERILDLADDVFAPTEFQLREPGVPVATDLTFADVLSFGPAPARLELRPLNVVIGPNGAGKSNLLELLDLLRCVPDSLLTTLKPNPREWLHQDGRKRASQASVRLRVGGGNLPARLSGVEYGLTFSAADGQERVVEETLRGAASVDQGEPYVYLDRRSGAAVVNTVRAGVRWMERQDFRPAAPALSELKDPSQFPEAAWLGKLLRSIRVYRGFPTDPGTPIREAQDPRGAEEHPSLRPDASNLCTVIEYLKKDRDVWPVFLGRLSDVYPSIRDLRTEPQGGNRLLIAEEDHGDTHVARLSDGTLKFICLLAVLMAPKPPPLVAFDEPEAGLHPDAVVTVTSLLEEASARCQVIVTTHSLMMVDSLKDGTNIVVCERDAAGTVFKRLAREELDHWLAIYKDRQPPLSELWMRGHIGGTR